MQSSKHLFHHLKGRGYNMQFILYPRLLRWRNKYSLCRMWHSTMGVMKRQFCYICICSFSIPSHDWDTNT